MDLAVRIGQPVDATLVARSVGGFGRALVAAPHPIWTSAVRRWSRRIYLAISASCMTPDRPALNGTSRGLTVHTRSMSSVPSAPRPATSCVRRLWPATGSRCCPSLWCMRTCWAARLRRLLPDYPTERSQLFSGLSVAAASGAANACCAGFSGRAVQGRRQPPAGWRTSGRGGRAIQVGVGAGLSPAIRCHGHLDDRGLRRPVPDHVASV